MLVAPLARANIRVLMVNNLVVVYWADEIESL